MRFVALLVALVVGVGVLAGCGSNRGSRGGGARVADPKPFPQLGYRYVPPHLPSHLAPGSVLLVDMTNAGGVRPDALRFASDGTLSGVHWRAWGTAQAVGHGTATVRICTTSCGAGYNQAYPATITVAGIKPCSGKRYYERAQVTLSTPGGRKPWGSYIHAPC
jgi:hypothetical protein